MELIIFPMKMLASLNINYNVQQLLTASCIMSNTYMLVRKDMTDTSELRIDDNADVLLDDINILRPRQNGRHFADEILKDIFLNENVWIPIKFSLKFVPEGPINIFQHWFR